MHHDDERPFAAKKIDEELEEGVDGKGLECCLVGWVRTTSWMLEKDSPHRYRVEGRDRKLRLETLYWPMMMQNIREPCDFMSSDSHLRVC